MTAVYPSVKTTAGADTNCPAFWDALREVMDPELPISGVDMGLIVALTEHAGVVEIKLTFTAMGCPAMEFLMEDIRIRLLQEPGVREVYIDVVWDPVWTKARLTEEGIEMLRSWGVSA
jgi:metal-sulfur cluster biosynthetic enzyme